jgi:hypothetical protein
MNKKSETPFQSILPAMFSLLQKQPYWFGWQDHQIHTLMMTQAKIFISIFVNSNKPNLHIRQKSQNYKIYGKTPNTLNTIN